MKPGGLVAIFDGDYASLTYAASNHEFDAEMVQAILAGVVANPYIMRELPALLRTSGLQIVSFYSNVLAEARAGQFFSSLAEAYVPAELESLSGMTGAQLPFGQGSNLFEALTLVSLSDHSLAKATQTMGAAVPKARSRMAGPQEQQRLAERPERLYGSLDAAKVHLRGETEHPWRDLKVGCWFTTTAQPPQSPDDEWDIQATDLSYYGDIQQARQFGQLWATGCQRQAQLAQELIFLGDGAEWIWNLVQEHYPQAVQIVDGFHATEYITPVAQAAFSHQDQRQAWIDQVRTKLRSDWVGHACSVTLLVRKSG